VPFEMFANNASTTLSAAVSSTSATSLTVASSTLFPSASSSTGGQFRILVGAEIMVVTNVSGTTWTVTRGAENTVATTHSSGAAVTHIVTAASAAPRWQLIASQTLAAQATTVTFSGLPQSFPTFMVTWNFPTMYNTAQPMIRLNNQSAASTHAYQYTNGTSSGGTATATGIWIALNTTTNYGAGVMFVDRLTSNMIGSYHWSSSVVVSGGHLNTPAAVTQIDFVSGAFAVGSTFSVYGL
jgi:hypothetical protein